MFERYAKIMGTIIKKTHEIIYVVNFQKVGKIPQFTSELKPIGKWYVTNGMEWVCHAECSLEEFKELFLSKITLSDSEKALIEFDTDRYPYGLVM